MTAATEISSKHLINILDFQDFLRSLWNDGDRPWDTVYSRESFRRFWDIRMPDVRKK